MQSQLLGHALIGFTMLLSLLWLGALPTEFVLRAAELLAAWCLLSTLVVICAGAWVALGRSRRREAEPLKARQLQ
ncbi:hypothetical protein ACFQY5_14720 [Paeniroseomonas aquatica]|uniref:Uncharacterized protein n=1 Tax=Paeniroseomonas aquatica TaxID=373043 RepID=A0ABT8A6X7_9PROT|nr:hypothetical protein [Paeniroseomonas aquatica]MDN3565554.1 hypothetical protein [Paeniroseomonas aquatica]